VRDLPPARTVRIVGAMLALLVALGAIFVWSGIYNVAASSDHLRITTWLLAQVRERSIDTRTIATDVPPLDDEGMVRLGASHFETACVSCHGRPGQKTNPVMQGMLPPPPDLAEVGKRRPPEEIFWIVKHGLKYTGMPAWPDLRREDEVWGVTAFLVDLPTRTADYPDMAGLSRGRDDSGDAGQIGSTAKECGRCHETGGSDTNGDRIPRLSGLSEAYILRSLQDYARGSRPSGVMQPIADRLDERAMRDLAARYSALGSPPERQAATAAAPGRVGRGEAIATLGVPESGVPACLSCHSGRQSPQFPVLAGQHTDYIRDQLKLWQRGGRVGTPYGRIMAAVATNLDADQIDAAAAYLSSLPPGTIVSPPVVEAER